MLRFLFFLESSGRKVINLKIFASRFMTFIDEKFRMQYINKTEKCEVNSKIIPKNMFLITSLISG